MENSFVRHVETAFEFGKILKKDLVRFEESIAIELPSSYREFLLETNGGVPSYEHQYVVVPPSCEPLCDIALYFGLSNACPDYARLPTALQSHEGRLPRKTVPIAEDSVGNLILIDVSSGKEYGGIYFWEHDMLPPEESYRAIKVIASSFLAFLGLTSSWAPAGNPAWLTAIESNEIDTVVRMIDDGLNVDVRFQDKSVIEYAAMHARTYLVKALAEQGAKLGDALQLAEKNYAFFPQHKSTVELLRRLHSRYQGR